jgi:hypothetical protein
VTVRTLINTDFLRPVILRSFESACVIAVLSGRCSPAIVSDDPILGSMSDYSGLHRCNSFLYIRAALIPGMSSLHTERACKIKPAVPGLHRFGLGTCVEPQRLRSNVAASHHRNLSSRVSPSSNHQALPSQIPCTDLRGQVFHRQSHCDTTFCII